MSMYELVKSIKTDVSDILVDAVGGGDPRTNVSTSGNFYYMQVGGNVFDLSVDDGDAVPGLFNAGGYVGVDSVYPTSFDQATYIVTSSTEDHVGVSGAQSLYLRVLYSSLSTGYAEFSFALNSEVSAPTGWYAILGGEVADTDGAVSNLNEIYFQPTGDTEDHASQIAMIPTNSCILNVAGIPIPPYGQVLLNNLVFGSLCAENFTIKIWEIIYNEQASVMTQVMKYLLFQQDIMANDNEQKKIDLSNTPPIKAGSAQSWQGYKHLIVLSIATDSIGANGIAYAYLNATLQINSSL